MGKSRLSDLEGKYNGDFGMISTINELINRAKNYEKLHYEDFCDIKLKLSKLAYELKCSKTIGDDMIYLKNLHEICSGINDSYYCEDSVYLQVDVWQSDLALFKNVVSECGIFEIKACKDKMDQILSAVQNNFEKLEFDNNQFPNILNSTINRAYTLRSTLKNLKIEVVNLVSKLNNLYDERQNLYLQYVNYISELLDDEAGDVKHLIDDHGPYVWLATTALSVGGEQAVSFPWWWDTYADTGDWKMGEWHNI